MFSKHEYQDTNTTPVFVLWLEQLWENQTFSLSRFLGIHQRLETKFEFLDLVLNKNKIKKSKTLGCLKTSEMGVEDQWRGELCHSKSREPGVNCDCNCSWSHCVRTVLNIVWMLQTRTWSIVTWDLFTMFLTSWHTTPHDLWHTCPCRHLNRNTTNSNTNQVCRVFCKTLWESISFVRY